MNGKTTVERLSELAPVRDEDLVSETWTPEARALLGQIVSTPLASEAAPRSRPIPVHAPRRRLLAIPALAAAVGVVGIGVLVSSGENGAANAAAASLRAAATVAHDQAPLTPGAGQYVYTKSVNAYTMTNVPVEGAAGAYTALIPHVREIWLGSDGGRLYETSGTPQLLSDQDRERWVAAGRPELSSPPSEQALERAKPLDLPTDADALNTRLKQDAAGRGNGLYSEIFTLIGDSLRETTATPAQRAALYQVAARLPEVELVGSAKDNAGRRGVAVAMTDQGIRFMLIFDPDTSALLAEEQVALAGNEFGYPAGTRIGYSTYLVQRIVDSDTATS